MKIVIRLSGLLFSLTLIMGVSVLPFMAKAASCMVNYSPTINMPDATLTPSDKGTVGTVLFTYSTYVPGLNYNCGIAVKSSWSSFYVRPEMTRNALDNVFNTNIAGIGIRVKWPVSKGTGTWVPGVYSCQGNCAEPADQILIEFVQTGVVASGTIPSGPVVIVDVAAENDPQNTKRLLSVNLGEVTVNVRACSIYANNNSIDLGGYNLSDVHKTGFVGSRKDFSITVDCPVQSSAKIRFEGKQAFGQSQGVLTTQSGDEAARNVFVKLYTKTGSRYSELKLNSDINFGSVSSFVGSRVVNYGAEMFFVDGDSRANVTAGNVNASVIYTLTIN